MNTKTTLAIVGMAAEIALISPSLVTNVSAKITQRLRRRNAFNPKVVRQMWERPPVLVSLRLKVSDMSSYKKSRPAGTIHLVLQAVRLDRTNKNIHLLSFFLFSFNLISHTLFYHYHTIGDFKNVTLIENNLMYIC
jgi:hypothetical protein